MRKKLGAGREQTVQNMMVAKLTKRKECSSEKLHMCLEVTFHVIMLLPQDPGPFGIPLVVMYIWLDMSGLRRNPGSEKEYLTYIRIT